LRNTTCPDASAPCAWNTCFAISKPIVLTSDTDASSKWCHQHLHFGISMPLGASTPSVYRTAQTHGPFTPRRGHSLRECARSSPAFHGRIGPWLTRPRSAYPSAPRSGRPAIHIGLPSPASRPLPVADRNGVIRDGHDDTQPCRQRRRCQACAGRLDDLTGAVLAGRRQPVRVRALCLCFMGLTLSNRQVALELGRDASGTQAMTAPLRRGLAAKAPAVKLTGEVEVSVVAGHEGQPEDGAERGGPGAAAGWPARRAEWPRVATAKPLEGQRRARHVGLGQAARPRPDPTRRPGGPARAGQRAARDDQADYHGRCRPGQPGRHGRGCPLRPPASLGLPAQDGLPCPRRRRPRPGWRRLLRGAR